MRNPPLADVPAGMADLLGHKNRENRAKQTGFRHFRHVSSPFRHHLNPLLDKAYSQKGDEVTIFLAIMLCEVTGKRIHLCPGQ